MKNFCIFILVFSNLIKADIYEYIYPKYGSSFSNYGSAGLIQSPTARFFDEGTLAFSWSHNDPYLRGSIIAYPFNWLEASFQYTDINNALYSDVKEFSGSQSLKDKSFDFKVKLLKESRRRPALAIGIRDAGGTGLFSSEYVVASKKVFSNIDFTIGVGWGNLSGNKISNPLTGLSSRFNSRNAESDFGGEPSLKNFFSGDAGYFLGSEIYVPKSRGLRFKLEYDGTNYLTEGPELLPQDSKLNFGLTYPVSNDFQLKLSYTRGNTINFGFSYALSLGEKNPRKMTKEPRPVIPNADSVKIVTGKSDLNLYRASLKYLGDNQLYLQRASIKEDKIIVEMSQSKYRNPAVAAGRAFEVLDQISPDKIKSIQVAEINGGLGVYKVSLDRKSLNLFKENPSSAVLNNISIKPYNMKHEKYDYNPESTYPVIFGTLSPDLQSQIGGPDGFFFGDLKLVYNSEILFQRNLSLISSFSVGLIDNMDDLKLPSDSILPHVRTDIVQYLKQSRDFAIKRIQLNYYGKHSDSLYYKLSGGIMESMFSGYGGEILYKPFSKNYGVGFEAWEVYQREYDQQFSLRDYKTVTGHLTLYYQEPNTNILFKLKGGRYLAKDSGVTVDFSRIFRSGLRIGAFFSLTDISAEEFGEGSFDKGFYFWVPVDIFSNRYFKRTFGWGLRPLTRDGAQTLVHGYPLWGVTDPSTKHLFRRNIYDFYD